jgi:hypothetical protein
VVPPATAAVGECPACGGPLYAWTQAPAAETRRHETHLLDACERCGLALLREADLDSVDLLAGATTRAGGRLSVGFPNRHSVQAGLGGGRWAALDLPLQQFAPTPEALAKLLEARGHRVIGMGQPPLGPNQLWMWQTLLNGLTFHPNFAREVIARRLRPSTARGRLAFAADAVVSLLAAPLVVLISLPLELVAVLLRRGGLVVATVEPGGESAQSRN